MPPRTRRTRRILRSVCAAGAASLLFLPFALGCSTARGPAMTYDLPTGFDGVGTVTIENAEGDVSIRTWDQETVEVRATAPLRVAGGDPGAAVEVEETSDGLIIRSLPDEDGEAQRVGLFVNVPERVNVKMASLKDGTLDLDGFTGAVSARVTEGLVNANALSRPADIIVVDGDINASFRDFPYVGEVKLFTTSGDIRIYVPNDSHASIQAVARRGTIEGMGELTGARVIDDLDGQTAVGRVGDGGPTRLTLTTGKGTIRFLKPREVELEPGLPTGDVFGDASVN